MRAIDMTKLTPKQFIAVIKKLKSEIKTSKSGLDEAERAAKVKLDKMRADLKYLLSQYKIKKYSGNTLYVDRLEFQGKTFDFGKKFNISAEARKRIEDKSESTDIYLIVSDEQGTYLEDKMFMAGISSANAFVDMVKNTVENYPAKKNELDKQVAKARKEIEQEEILLKNKITELKKIEGQKIKHAEERLQFLMENATPAQLKELNKKKRIIKICGIVLLALIVISGIANAINEATERGRNYYINISDEFIFDCNAKFDDNTKSIKCGEREISGNFSNYESVILRSEGTERGLIVNQNKFTRKIPQVNISSSYYKTEKYSNSTIKSVFSKATESIEIYNTVLNEQVVKKIITIHWRFSEADYKLFAKKNEEWKAQEAERKAKKEQERKEKEAERKAKEEQERKEREEAARIEAEKKAAEEAQKKKDECAAKGAGYWWDGANCNYNPPVSTPPNSRSYSSRSNSNNSPNSGVTNTVSGYCNDGTYVTGNPSARGRANACYGHKGWRDY